MIKLKKMCCAFVLMSLVLRIAQITDPHLFAESNECLLGVRTTDSFLALMNQLQQLNPRPDLLLLTGDLSQDGSVASYKRLQTLLSPLSIPVYWLPGNHDCVETMTQTLNHSLFQPDKSFQRGGWQFILLNSQERDRVHGRLSQESLQWLDRELNRSPNHPTLVSLHHPPFAVNSDWLDTSILQNTPEFLAVLDRHPQVKLVVFGHIHQEYEQIRHGITFLGTPSTCIQFEPESANFALGHQEPGFRMINLYANGDWDSHVKRVEFAYQLDLAATGY